VSQLFCGAPDVARKRPAVCVQLNQRREACEVKSTAARNDYLLSLTAANAHLQRYYNSDTPELMKV